MTEKPTSKQHTAPLNTALNDVKLSDTLIINAPESRPLKKIMLLKRELK